MLANGWRSSPGSLIGFAAAQNWSSRSLVFATNWQSCAAYVPAVPGSPASIDFCGSGPTGCGHVASALMLLVKPATVVQWHRQGFRLYWRWRSRLGRPRADREIRDLIRRMSRANPLWGAPRIHGELLKLGLEISQATVAKYMVRRPRLPSPTWRSSLRNQADGIAAIDMFTVPSATGCCLSCSSWLTAAGRLCASTLPSIPRQLGFRSSNRSVPVGYSTSHFATRSRLRVRLALQQAGRGDGHH